MKSPFGVDGKKRAACFKGGSRRRRASSARKPSQAPTTAVPAGGDHNFPPVNTGTVTNWKTVSLGKGGSRNHYGCLHLLSMLRVCPSAVTQQSSAAEFLTSEAEFTCTGMEQEDTRVPQGSEF